jgi:hypothetical protein
LALAALLSKEWRRDYPVEAGGAQSAAAKDTQRHTRDGYVGDAACQSCHADKVDSFHRTAHYLTSRAPDETTILGKFTPGSNIMRTSNPNLYFRMDEQRTDGREAEFFQIAVAGTAPHTTTRTERIGVVVGSGGKGQTYLYWDEDQLF